MNVVILLLFAFLLGLASLDWFGWPFLVVSICLMLAAFLMATGGYGLMQLRWPERNNGFINDLDGAKLGTALVVGHFMIGPGILCAVLWELLASQRVTPLTAGIIAVAVLLLATAAALASRRRRGNVLQARGRELLLKDPSH